MDLMDFRGPKGVKLSPLIVNRHRFQIKMALSICLVYKMDPIFDHRVKLHF